MFHGTASNSSSEKWALPHSEKLQGVQNSRVHRSSLYQRAFFEEYLEDYSANDAARECRNNAYMQSISAPWAPGTGESGDGGDIGKRYQHPKYETAYKTVEQLWLRVAGLNTSRLWFYCFTYGSTKT